MQNLLALHCCAIAIAWPLPCTRSAPYSLYLLAIDPLSTAHTPSRFTMASPTIVRLRHHTESTLAATRTLHENMDITHETPCTLHPLQRIITNTSTWTRRRLTEATTTDRANSHDSLTHPTPRMTILMSSSTAPRHHLAHQRSPSATLLTTTCRLPPFVASPSDDRLILLIVASPSDNIARSSLHDPATISPAPRR